MPGYEKMESLTNGGSWGKFWWKTCGFEWVKKTLLRTLSSQQHLLEVPRTKLVSFSNRSFKVVGPRLWNALPIAIKRIVT